MANHALPITTSLYTDVLTNLKDRIDDSLKMLDSVNTTPTNVPTNSVRFNSTTFLWEKYNGSAWVSLASSYAIQVSKSINLTGGNSTTLLGAIHYQSNTDTSSILSPNTTTTRKFLRQTGTGTNGAAPVWDTILASDVPTLNQNTTGSAATLTTARTINGVSFNGSANINIEDRIGTAIASAATITIGTAGLGDYIHITGTTAITSLGTAATAGIRRTLIFDSAGCVLTHNATSLICTGAENITSVAGTIIEVVAETTTNWRVVSITHPSISATELGYLDGVTSSVQTQINTLVAVDDALKDVPQNAQTAAYTLALTDRGKSIDVSTGGITITVPLNSAVAFPIGATVSITNLAATAITVSSSATLRQAGTANTGSRTLAAYGMATLRKVATDTWFISGAGLS